MIRLVRLTAWTARARSCVNHVLVAVPPRPCAPHAPPCLPQIPVEPYTRREFLRMLKRYARVEQVVNGETRR